MALSDFQTQHAKFVSGGATPKGYEQVTSMSSAAGLTVPAGSEAALLEAEDQNIRWRDDGTDPTTTVGMTLYAGDTLIYTGKLSTIKFIEETATAKLNVSYYGRAT